MCITQYSVFYIYYAICAESTFAVLFYPADDKLSIRKTFFFFFPLPFTKALVTALYQSLAKLAENIVWHTDILGLGRNHKGNLISKLFSWRFCFHFLKAEIEGTTQVLSKHKLCC